MHLPKGAALGYVIPSSPALPLVLCWTLVAVGCSWLNHKAQQVFLEVDTHMCTPPFMLPCLSAQGCSPLRVPAHAQQHFLQQSRSAGI